MKPVQYPFRINFLKPSLILVPIIAILTARPGRGAVFPITNNSDSGVGSLRDAVTNSNSSAGANTISWGLGSGGSTALVTDLPSIGANTILDVTSAPSSVSLSGVGAIPLGGAVTFNNGNVGQTWSIANTISGAGSFTQTGAGTIALSGNNTFTGGAFLYGGTLSVASDAALGVSGPLYFNGGKLLTTTGITSSRTFVFNSQGGTIDTGGNNSILSGTVEGAGTLIKNGAGTLFLTGPNNSAGAVLNAGTLNVNSASALGGNPLTINGGTFQPAANVTFGNLIYLNSAATFDTVGSTATLDGVISGVGSLTNVSTGTLRLTGTNTYSGGTYLNSGALNINSDAALGYSTGTLTFNGGILQAGATFISNRPIILASQGLIDTNGYNATLTGTISGGGLLKTGEGTLTIGAPGIVPNNTYNGGTIIDMGTLALGTSNALPSSKPLTIRNGATFDMGGFSQNLSSFNIATGGILKMNLQNPPSTQLSVNGTADINGGILVVTPPTSYLIKKTDNFKPIVAGGRIGTFGAILSPAALSFVADYSDSNSVILNVKFLPLAGVAANGNQAAVGNGLEPLRANPTGDAATVLGSLYTLDPSSLRSALDQIGPVSLASMSGVGMASSSVESAALNQRMAVLARGSGGGVSSYSLANHSSHPGTLLASAANNMGVLDEPSGENRDWGTFATAGATTGRLREANSDSGTQPGYAFNSGGLTVGADYRFNEHLAAGLSAGYLHGHSSIYAPASGTVDNNSTRYGAYATAFTDLFRANIYLGGASDSFSTRRGINFGAISRTATASPSGSEMNLDANMSYDIPLSSNRVFSPFTGIAYDRLDVRSFTESGADSLDLTVSPQTAESLRSSLGVRYSEKFDLGSYSLTPLASLGWRHEFLSQNRPIEAQLASGAGGLFSVSTGKFAQDGTLIGLGLSGAFGEQTSAKFDYSGDFRSHFMDNTFTLTLRYKF